MKAKLVCDTLQMVQWRRRPKLGLIHLSDRGSQYTSDAFRTLLKDNKIVGNMSRKGNCWDNAPMERFFRSLKTEWVPRLGYASLIDAKGHILRYLTGYYASVRPHQHNDGLFPNARELKYQKT